MTRQATGPPTRRAPAIAIIGLGPTGRALGLSLQRVKSGFRLVGHDRDAERMRRSRASSAIDEGRPDPIAAVSDADIVFLTETTARSAETLAAIAPHLLPGALVTSTCSPMVPVMEAAGRHLPARVAFAGGHPILRSPSMAVPEERAFEGVEYCLSPLAAADASAVRVLAELVTAIGAKPYFIDGAEHDALEPAVSLLPGLLDDLLTRILGDSPSARDIRRLAARVGDNATSNAAEAGARREALVWAAPSLVPWLDALTSALLEWRDAAQATDPDRLLSVLDATDEARARWESTLEPPDT